MSKKQHTNFLVEDKSGKDIRNDFPHDPEDSSASQTAYLEDRLAHGWRLVSAIMLTTGEYRYIFTAVH